MSQIDLSSIDQKLLLARGQYATVRSAREDALKLLQRQCSDLQSLPSGIMRVIQEGQPVDDLVAAIDDLSARIKEQCETVLALTEQKNALKPIAWGKTSTVKE